MAEDLNSLPKCIFTTGSFKETLQRIQDAKATQLLDVWQNFSYNIFLERLKT